MREPRFDIDYEWGRQGELLVDDYLKWVAQGDARVEVKRKSYVDLELYVEYEHDPGRTGCYVPSGISTTESEVWAYVIGDTGMALLVPCDLLREATAHPAARHRVERDGSCPTRGMLVNVGLLMTLARAKTEAT